MVGWNGKSCFMGLGTIWNCCDDRCKSSTKIRLHIENQKPLIRGQLKGWWSGVGG